MIEERDKGELVHDFLSGTPHIFAMVEGDDMSVSMEGKGGDILVLWTKLTMDLMEKMGQDDPKALLQLDDLLALETKGISRKEYALDDIPSENEIEEGKKEVVAKKIVSDRGLTIDELIYVSGLREGFAPHASTYRNAYNTKTYPISSRKLLEKIWEKGLTVEYCSINMNYHEGYLTNLMRNGLVTDNVRNQLVTKFDIYYSDYAFSEKAESFEVEKSLSLDEVLASTEQLEKLIERAFIKSDVVPRITTHITREVFNLNNPQVRQLIKDAVKEAWNEV